MQSPFQNFSKLFGQLYANCSIAVYRLIFEEDHKKKNRILSLFCFFERLLMKSACWAPDQKAKALGARFTLFHESFNHDSWSHHVNKKETVSRDIALLRHHCGYSFSSRTRDRNKLGNSMYNRTLGMIVAAKISISEEVGFDDSSPFRRNMSTASRHSVPLAWRRRGRRQTPSPSPFLRWLAGQWSSPESCRYFYKGFWPNVNNILLEYALAAFCGINVFNFIWGKRSERMDICMSNHRKVIERLW